MSDGMFIDPVLTSHVRGYKNAERVGQLLFPTVYVGTRSGKVIQFGKEAFMLYSARRAPGAKAKQVEFGFEGKDFVLVQDSLDGKVPREYQRDASKTAKLDMGMRMTNLVMNSLTLALEYEQAKIATNPAKFGGQSLALTGPDKWSADTSDPQRTVEDARQTIRQACGLYPNVMIAGPQAYSALKQNEKIKAKFANTDIITASMMSQLFEIDTLIEGRAVTADEDGVFSDIWGNNVVLAYAPREPSGVEEPSFGYTYTMDNHPYVEEPRWDGSTRSQMYGVTYERVPVLAGMSAGFLLTDVA